MEEKLNECGGGGRTEALMRAEVFANSRELERFARGRGLRRCDVVSVVWAEPLGGLVLTWFGD